MLNIDTLGVKKYEANKQQVRSYVQPKTLSAKAKESLIKDLLNYT